VTTQGNGLAPDQEVSIGEMHRQSEDKPLKPRSLAIDCLRGVAILAVMARHLPFSSTGTARALAPAWSYPPEPWPSIMNVGEYGVQLFLVISGYCIHMRWARQANLETTVDFWPFWKRRLVRLYPPYITALILTLVCAKIAHALPYKSTSELLLDLFVLLTLTQNLTNASIRVGNGPFWSLALEEQLYLLYFPLLTMRRRWGWPRALVVVASVNLLWIFVCQQVSVPQGLFRAGPAYWLAWCLGAVVLEAHLGYVKLPKYLLSWTSFAVAFAVGLCLPHPWKDLGVTLSFGILVGVTVGLDARPRFQSSKCVRMLVWLGEISFSVYLIHNLFFIAAKRLAVSLAVAPFAIIWIRFSAGLLAGYCFYLAVERRFMLASRTIPVNLKLSSIPTQKE
jgi:peptidoglycan/LPS O-acetylase OafA/YrhL